MAQEAGDLMTDTERYTLALTGQHPSAARIMWAWRKDRGEDQMHTMHGTYAECGKSLHAANSDICKCGIFCLINESAYATRRRKQDIRRVRAVWADFDGAQQMPELHLEPSMVVQTRNGYHVYYILESGVDSITWGEDMNRHVAQKYGADPRACDAARVLRVPGFYHHKSTPPYMVTLQACTGKRYTKAQLETALGAPERPQEASYGKTAMSPLKSAQDTAWGVAAALGEKRKVSSTPEGSRNHQLATSAFKLGQIVGGGRLTEHSATLALQGGARENGYEEEEGETGVLQIIASGLREGAKRPRHA